MDALVTTQFQHGKKDLSHPSYQAWSYAALLENFNEAVEQGGYPSHALCLPAQLC